jgi:hypothetical protein
LMFSDPIPIRYGTYNQVDVTTLSSLDSDDNHVAVLLAGGNCNDWYICGVGGYTEPAVVIDVQITGCSAFQPTTPCKLNGVEINNNSSNNTAPLFPPVIWTEPLELFDPNGGGNRDGLFSHELGNGIDPTIVLVGAGCLNIYHPATTTNDGNRSGGSNGPFSVVPNFSLLPEDKVVDFEDGISRSSGVAAGIIGQTVGLVMATRARSRLADDTITPLVVVTQSKNQPEYQVTNDGTTAEDSDIYTYSHWQVDGDRPRLYNDNGYSLESTDVTLADLDGDGNVDIIPVSVS